MCLWTQQVDSANSESPSRPWLSRHPLPDGVDEQDRICRHMRVFVNADQVFELSRALQPSDEVIIVQALTGG
jgi:hypothetical protein